MPPELVDRPRALRFRAAAQGLGSRSGTVSGAASGGTIQDTPPGHALLALAARVEDVAPDAVEAAVADGSLLLTYNARLAPALLPRDEAPVFLAALRPAAGDEAGWGTLLARAIVDDALPATEALALARAAARDTLDGQVLSRDELHAGLRERLPGALLPWCAGCGSHHVRRQLLGALFLCGDVRFAGRAGRQPAFTRVDPPLPDVAPGDWLARAFLRRYAPATRAGFLHWAGSPTAPAAWDAAPKTEIRVEGRRCFALPEDVPRLLDPPRVRGVRLLAAGEPYLLARDRELLVPDAAERKRIWPVLAGPGLVLLDGEPAGTWRMRKQGGRLLVGVSATRGVDRGALAIEAARLAPLRGCRTAEIIPST